MLWRDVPADAVLGFLDSYQMHEKSPDRDTSLIRRYIEKRIANGALDCWNVAIVGSRTSGCDDYDLGSECPFQRASVVVCPMRRRQTSRP